jgi:Putative prokaryotic signal transducing protein
LTLSITHTAMHRIYSNPDPAMAHLVQHALEREGIEAVVRGDRLGAAVGEVPWTDAWAEVWVGDEARLEEARTIVTEATTPQAVTSWTCPGCGEQVEGTFGSCWQCGTLRPEA